mgnify:CR=1 FL=1
MLFAVPSVPAGVLAISGMSAARSSAVPDCELLRSMRDMRIVLQLLRKRENGLCRPGGNLLGFLSGKRRNGCADGQRSFCRSAVYGEEQYRCRNYESRVYFYRVEYAGKRRRNGLCGREHNSGYRECNALCAVARGINRIRPGFYRFSNLKIALVFCPALGYNEAVF